MILKMLWMILFICGVALDPPKREWTNGYNNANCEAHPHSGVELEDGGWLMVGDSVCWDGTAKYKRAIFVVVTNSDGSERWNKVLGNMGYNYGKYGTQIKDGSIIVAGSKSIEDSEAASKGFSYIEVRALWRLNVNTGNIISETLLPNNGKLEGLRDGFMCVSPTTDGSNAVVATGYVGSEANWDGKNYDDEPMFFVYGGTAFAMRVNFLAINETQDTADAQIQYDVNLGLNETYGYVPFQGMRIRMRGEFMAIAAASSTGPYDGNYAIHFSVLVLHADSGDLLWVNMYKGKNAHMSHPYAMTLSLEDDPTPGIVVAGHIFYPGLQPHGRLLKVGYNGDVIWDRDFTDRDDTYFNIECYGVDTAPDGGYVVACGDGCEEPPKWMNCHEATWTAFVYRADTEGNPLWVANMTDASSKCISDATEHIVVAKDGGFGVYIDSGTLGRPGTGGNFGLVRLASDTILRRQITRN